MLSFNLNGKGSLSDQVIKIEEESLTIIEELYS